MRILVTHLTRMRGEHICVAGLTNTGEHVRPVAAEKLLDRSHLVPAGGLFAMGAVVELGETEDVSLRPEVEDRLFLLDAAKHEFNLEPDVYWSFLNRHLKPGLAEIFGPDMGRVGSTMTVPLGQGEASLGAFKPPAAPKVFLDQRGKIRAQIPYRGATLQLPVTDIRLYDETHLAPRERVMTWLNQAVVEGCVLTVGLGRPFKGTSRPAPEHWLQINNIHPASDPLWRTAPI